MPKRSKPDSRPSLNAVLDLKAAAPLAELLLARRGGDLEIDGSHVERLGAQCLQVLLSARNSWTADGHDFHVANLPQPVLATLELLGVEAVSLSHRRNAAS